MWASRSAGTGVRATSVDGGWRLAGELRFASGISLIDRALVPGWLDEEHHLLFDVAAASASADESTWRTTAMDASRSFTVALDVECYDHVGPTDFYLERPGFVVGGLCVAAVWAGGLQQVVDLVATGIRDFAPSAHQLRRIGVMEQAQWQAHTAVRTAVDAVVRPRSRAGSTPSRTHAPPWRQRATRCSTRPARWSDPAASAATPGWPAPSPTSAIYVRQHHTDGELEQAGRRAVETHTLLG